jgi:prepilin-type N-terminal cleavage/methylation domain-containing protein
MRELNKLALETTHSTNRVLRPEVRRLASFGKFKIGNRNGFTLIELLVVIATIAVLLAILMPALRRAKALAQGVACRANLKQLATAWNLYLDDNEGYFYQGVNANLNYGGWQGQEEQAKQGAVPRPLNKYLGLPEVLETEDSAKVFRCPGDRGGIANPNVLYEKVFRYFGTSYQTNIFLIGQNACGTFSTDRSTAELDAAISARLTEVNRSEIGNPARILLIGDYGWINQWMPAQHPLERYEGILNQKGLKELAEWHGRVDCYNMAFLDSHAQLLNIRKGFYVTDEYSVLPFEELNDLAYEVQGYQP